MLENWVFTIAYLLVSLLFVFHGLVMLIAPQKSITLASDRFPPEFPPRVELRRKPPLFLGTRIMGILFAGVGIVFMGPGLSWMRDPIVGKIDWGKPLLPPGVPRWDLAGLGLFLLSAGCYLLLKPQRSVDIFLRMVSERPIRPSTVFLWTVYVRIFAVALLSGSVLQLKEFIISLRFGHLSP